MTSAAGLRDRVEEAASVTPDRSESAWMRSNRAFNSEFWCTICKI